MADYATFVAEYPEFLGVDAALVTAKLNRAISELDPVIWDTLFDNGAYLLAAQKLAKMPSGNTSRLVNKDGSTVYDDDLELLRAIVVGGVRVAGQQMETNPPLGPPIGISGATNASPIVLTVADTSSLRNGQSALVAGVLGNTGANGTWVITVLGPTTLSLGSSIGNGVYTGGGILQAIL